MRDGSGRKISRQPVPLNLMVDSAPNEDHIALIDAAVPFHKEMAKIELELDGAVVAQYPG